VLIGTLNVQDPVRENSLELGAAVLTIYIQSTRQGIFQPWTRA
jgi:hypothetical protein